MLALIVAVMIHMGLISSSENYTESLYKQHQQEITRIIEDFEAN